MNLIASAFFEVFLATGLRAVLLLAFAVMLDPVRAQLRVVARAPKPKTGIQAAIPGFHKSQFSHGEGYAIGDEEEKAKSDARCKQEAQAAAAAKPGGHGNADDDHHKCRKNARGIRFCHQV